MRLTYNRPAPAHAADRPTVHRVDHRLQRRAARIERISLADRLAYWRARWMR